MDENTRLNLTYVYQSRIHHIHAGIQKKERKTLRHLEVQVLKDYKGLKGQRGWELRWWACLVDVNDKTSKSSRCLWRARSDQSG